jgi:type VI secretion system protein ImpM
MPIGLYGKYPGKRDFLATNVPRHVLAPFENWLQGGMAASKERLGRSWGDLYHVQPIWNFWIGASIAGVDCVGAMIPSVDRVGRLFPLVIFAHASPGEAGFPAWHNFLTSDWLLPVHERLLLALADNAPEEQISLIEGLSDPEAVTELLPDTALRVGNGIKVLLSDFSLAQVTETITRVHAITGDAARSIWWTAGSVVVPAQVASFIGMPGLEFMADMMSRDGTGK